MASISPDYAPNIDGRLLARLGEPADVIVHGPDEIVTKTGKEPEGRISTLNARLNRAAVHRFRKAVYKTMYPYGFDFVRKEQRAHDGELASGKGPVDNFVKLIRKRVWKKAYRKTYRDYTGEKLGSKDVPKSPSMKILRPLIEKNLGKLREPDESWQTAPEAAGDGLHGRGTSGKSYYTSSGSGFASHAAMARGDGLIAFLIGTVAPLIIKGVKWAASHGKKIAKAVKKIGSKVVQVGKKVVGSKAAKKIASALTSKAAKKIASTVAGVVDSKEGKEALGTAANAAISAVVKMKPGQAGKEEVEEKEEDIPEIPFPETATNPVLGEKASTSGGPPAAAETFAHWYGHGGAMPMLPVPRWHTGPMNPLHMMRQIYSRAQHGIVQALVAHGVKPADAIIESGKYLHGHAASHIGKGASDAIFRPYRASKVRGDGMMMPGKPMKRLTPFNLLRPLFQVGVTAPSDIQAMKAALRHKSLTAKRGGGLGAMMKGMADHILGARSGDEDGAEAIPNPYKMGKHIVKTVTKTIGYAPLIPKHDLSQILGETLAPPELMEAAEGGRFYTSRRKYDANLHMAAGAGFWDLVRGIAQIAAPLGGVATNLALANKMEKKLGKKGSKQMREAISQAGQEASKAIAATSERRSWEQAQDRERKLEGEERARAIAEYKKAREIGPEEFQKIRMEAEHARNLADLLQGSKLETDLPDPRKYRSYRSKYDDDEPKTKRYMTGSDVMSELRPRRSARLEYDDGEEKEKRKRRKKKAKKQMKKEMMTREEWKERKGKKKQRKLVKEAELEQTAKARQEAKEAKRLEMLERSEAEREAAEARKLARREESHERAIELASAREAAEARAQSKRKESHEKTSQEMLEKEARATMKAQKRLMKKQEEESVRAERAAAKAQKKALKGRGEVGAKLQKMIEDKTLPGQLAPRYKTMYGTHYTVGPTTASMINGRRRAGTVLLLSKKMKEAM